MPVGVHLEITMEITGIEGRITYCGVIVDYCAKDTEDDGFCWGMRSVEFDPPMTCVDAAAFMSAHGDSIEEAVRQQFLADVQRAKDDAAIDRWESDQLGRKAG